jgi:hypothetical protein
MMIRTGLRTERAFLLEQCVWPLTGGQRSTEESIIIGRGSPSLGGAVILFLLDQENNDTPLLKTVANSVFTDNNVLGIVRVIVRVTASSCPLNVLKTWH